VEINIVQEEGLNPVTVLQPIGELTSDKELIAQAQAVYDEGGRDILIDLSQVRYMSSIGLRAIHELFLLMKTDDVNESRDAMMEGIRAGTFTSPHLKLYKPNPDVMSVLKTTGYDMYIEIYSDYDQAIASFQNHKTHNQLNPQK
jgi:anti-anti-sigma regulatory factor